jgi:hypothetical protein
MGAGAAVSGALSAALGFHDLPLLTAGFLRGFLAALRYCFILLFWRDA